MRDKNADEEFLDEILPSCSRTLPGITGVGKFDGRTTVLIDAKTEVVKSILLYPRAIAL
jgi:hypothetical protein